MENMTDFNVITTGPVVRSSPTEVDVSDYAAAREVHSIGTKFYKTEFYRRLTQYDIEILFNTSDPKFHGDRRRLFAAPMSNSSIQKLAPLIDARVHLVISKIRGEMEARGAADVYKWWIFMATDVSGKLCFGDSFRTLEHGNLGILSTSWDMELTQSRKPNTLWTWSQCQPWKQLK